MGWDNQRVDSAAVPEMDTPAWWTAVGDFLRLWRKRNELTQQQLADAAHVARDTVVRIEGGVPVKLATLRDLCAALALSDTRSDEAKRFFELAFLRPALQYAGVGAVPALVAAPASDEGAVVMPDLPVIAEGDPAPLGLFWERDGRQRIQVESWTARPHEPALRDLSCYAVRVRGDAMAPLIKRGYCLFVSPPLPLEDGDLAYVGLRSGEALLKLVSRQQQGWLLEALNRAHLGRFVADPDVATMHKVAYIRAIT